MSLKQDLKKAVENNTKYRVTMLLLIFPFSFFGQTEGSRIHFGVSDWNEPGVWGDGVYDSDTTKAVYPNRVKDTLYYQPAWGHNDTVYYIHDSQLVRERPVEKTPSNKVIERKDPVLPIAIATLLLSVVSLILHIKNLVKPKPPIPKSRKK